MSRSDTYPQHVVTAVIVAHDGAPWLPHVIDALLGQTRSVQRVVAVDTGSRDRSGRTLAARLGQAAVFGMDRSTGYGAAVAKALQHKAANASVPGQSAHSHSAQGQSARARTDSVEWVWLLHDDCEPAPDALEQLLRGAAETPNAAILGPKVKDWLDRDVILEAGVTIDTVGRRITGIEPREVDQGQHDGDRDTLAVGSAGMLVRRDVWDLVRGFDTSMGLFREDVDFCWRVHAAGYRVRVITDAVVFHAQAMTRRRRAVSLGRRPQMLDRRNALLTLAANLPLRPMLASMAGNVTVSFLRALFFLVAKRATAALDESAAVASVLCHPLRLLRARRLRATGRKAAYGRLRADLPPGRSLRRIAEFIAAMSGTAQQDTAGSHHATEDPDAADDFLLTDSGFLQRVLTSPSVLLLLGLLIVTGVAERSLLSAGTLGGGALLPATGAAGLWHQYLQGFHPTGIGSPSIAPPYLAIMAILATAATGKAWLAVDVVLLGSVPIAGMTAYLAVRRVTRSVPVRVWAAATYALIPVATGAISAGRLGTAAAFALIPLIGLLAGRMFSQPPRIARRAAWATGLAVAVAAAFVPLLWPIALLAGAAAALLLRRVRPGILINLGIAAIVPLVLLIPWTFQLAAHPSAVLLEAGVQQSGLTTPGLPTRSLMLLSPGGPGLPPVWVTAGLILAALAALLLSRRRGLVLSGWTVAILGLLVAAGVSRLSVRPAVGGAAVTVWPGAALAVTAAGLLLAAAAGGDSLGGAAAGVTAGLRRVASLRGLLVAVLVAAACSAPAAAAWFWVRDGVSGPVGPATDQVVPALVSVSAGSGAEVRTLVLRSAGSRVSYQLLRGSGPTLGDADLTPVPAADRALRTAVATLAAPAGGQAVDQGQLLARFDIGYVLMRAPLSPSLERTLDGVAGLRPVSKTPAFGLWRLASPPSRVSILESNGTVVPVPSGQVGVTGATAPAAGGTLMLAEPAGGWHATLNGRPLTAVPSPSGSWAQAFRLPGGGGTLTVGRSELGHDLAITLELLAALVVAALALPGVRASGEVLATAEDASSAGARDSGASNSGASNSGASNSGASNSSASNSSASDSGAPDSGAPGSGAPGSGASDRGASDRGAPDRGAPSGGEAADGAAGGRGRPRGHKPGRRGRRGGPAHPAVPGPPRPQPAVSAGRERQLEAAGPLAERSAGPQDWTESDMTDTRLAADPAGRAPAGGAPAGSAPAGGAAGWAGRDAGVRSPTGAWPYPDEAWTDDQAGPPAMQRPYLTEPRRGQPGLTSDPQPKLPGSPPAPSGNWPPADEPDAPYGKPSWHEAAQPEAPPSGTPGWQEAAQPEHPYGAPSWPEAAEPEARPFGAPSWQEAAEPEAHPYGAPSWPEAAQPEQAASWQEAAQPRRPRPSWPGIEPPPPPRSSPGRPEPSSSPASGQPSSWPASEQSGGWPATDQPDWPDRDQSPSRPGGGRPPDWPAGQSGGNWRGGAQPPSGSLPYRAQPEWQSEAQAAEWASSGDSLEPLPSTQVHPGSVTAEGPGARSRRRWPAPDDDRDEGDAP